MTASSLFLAALSVLLTSRASADESFPDEWFLYGEERPPELRALEGKPAAEIAAAEWRGDSVQLRDLVGKVVVLDFWATWCGPCIAAIPKNIELVEEYGDRGLAFIGLHDSKSGWDRVDRVIGEKRINYPVALDDSGKSASRYNLRFWPTYVVIDRAGVVRAAGLSPKHVKDAVEVLLAEPHELAASGAPPKAGFPDEFFYGGEKRPSWLRAVEGERLETLDGSEWVGERLRPSDWNRKILVVQFIHPIFALSFEHLQALDAVRAKLSRQGVVFAAVCDARADFKAASAAVKARGISTPVVHDRASEEAETGVIAETFGVRFSQPLAVVDRAGVIRANGLNPESLESVLDTLLAEAMPALDRPEREVETDDDAAAADDAR